MTSNSEARKRREEAVALDFEAGVLDGVPCDHFIHIVPANIRERDEVFYCPKCGVKL